MVAALGARGRARNFLHGLHVTLPTLTRLVSPLAIWPAVALETRIGRLLLVLSLSFSFALLSFFFSFFTAFVILIALAVLVALVVLSKALAVLSFAVTLLAFVSCLALHRSDFHRNRAVTIILSLLIIQSMPLEELRNLLDSELANTFLIGAGDLDNTIAHFCLSLNISPVAFWKSTI